MYVRTDFDVEPWYLICGTVLYILVWLVNIDWRRPTSVSVLFPALIGFLLISSAGALSGSVDLLLHALAPQRSNLYNPLPPQRRYSTYNFEYFVAATLGASAFFAGLVLHHPSSAALTIAAATLVTLADVLEWELAPHARLFGFVALVFGTAYLVCQQSEFTCCRA
jgi:hypothetical protein